MSRSSPGLARSEVTAEVEEAVADDTADVMCTGKGEVACFGFVDSLDDCKLLFDWLGFNPSAWKKRRNGITRLVKILYLNHRGLRASPK